MITYDAYIRFAKTLEGRTLQTRAQRKRFIVQVEGNNISFTPETRKPRNCNKASTEKVLARFNQTKSLSPGHYLDITANASYHMRILEMMTSEKRATTP
jgi:hypothetical protein